MLDAQDTIYRGMIKQAVLPGDDGQFSVLDFHQPFIYRLTKGNIFLDRIIQFKIKEGVARMRGNELILLVEKHD